MGEKKTRICLRDIEVLGSFENGRCFSKAGEHQTIPRGQDFFVSPRLDSFFAVGEKLFASAADDLLQCVDGDVVPGGGVRNRRRYVQDILSFEVPAFGHVEVVAKEASVACSQNFQNFLTGPDEKLSF